MTFVGSLLSCGAWIVYKELAATEGYFASRLSIAGGKSVLLMRSAE